MANTMIVTQDHKGRTLEVSYCGRHLALTLQNMGMMRAGESFYATPKACECCEWGARADRNEADRDGRVTEAAERSFCGPRD